jgi:hypothetical protein
MAARPKSKAAREIPVSAVVSAAGLRTRARADRPERSHSAFVRIGRKRAHDHPHPAHPVDQRVMHLAVDGEAIAFQSLD